MYITIDLRYRIILLNNMVDYVSWHHILAISVAISILQNVIVWIKNEIIQNIVIYIDKYIFDPDWIIQTHLFNFDFILEKSQRGVSLTEQLFLHGNKQISMSTHHLKYYWIAIQMSLHFQFYFP